MRMFETLADAPAVLKRYDKSATIDRDGNRPATVYHWLHVFDGAGRVDAAVAAVWLSCSCCRRGDQMTGAAYHPTDQAGDMPSGGDMSFRRTSRELLTVHVPPQRLQSELMTLRRD